MVNIEDRKIPKELVSGVGFVDYDSPLSSARQALRDAPAVVVTKDGEYYGIIDSRALEVSSMKLSPSEKAGKLAIKAPLISDSSSVEDLAYYFYKLRIKNLPYVYDEKITGVMERKTLLKMLLSLHALKETKVNDALSSPVLSIEIDATLAQALNAMSNSKVNRLIVLDDGKFAGIVTKRVIHSSTPDAERLPERKAERAKATNSSIEGIMERNAHTIEPSDSLADAAKTMVEENVYSLVVTRGKVPMGILTISDILESVVAKRKAEEKRVFLTGFDEYTFQYEESVREELKSFMHHIEQMHKLNTEYLALRVKRVKLKQYEMQARISLGNNGMLRAHSDGESFHDAFRELMKRLKTQSVKQKDEMISDRKKRKDVKED